MEKQQSHQPLLRLPLPNYFKKIGIGTILTVIIVSIFNPEAFKYSNQLSGQLLIAFLSLGLLLYGGAKEKIEDELIAKTRMKSMAYAFIIGAITQIINPIIMYISHNQINDMPGKLIIPEMLIMYLIFFHHNKKSM
jgi:hypothetical protein